MIKYLIKFIKDFILKLILKYKHNNIKLVGRVSSDFKTKFEGYNLINKNVSIKRSFLGYGTYISGETKLTNAKIGRFCSIGRNVRNYFAIHPTKNFVTTHPAFFSVKKQSGFTFVNSQKIQEHKFIDKEMKYIIEIGNDVWIGNNVMILDGIKIGDGAIIAAGSIVTKDIEPYTVVGGVPAKTIRKRFSNEHISFLLNFKWWEKDFNWLKNNVDFFESIESFHKRYKNNLNGNS